MKKGQLTVLVLAGLVLLILLGGAFYLRTLLPVPPVKGIAALGEQQDAQTLLEGCATDLALQAVTLQLAQGGYAELPRTLPLKEMDSRSLVILYDQGVSHFPDAKRRQRDLEAFLHQALPACLTALPGYHWTPAPPRTSAILFPDEILLTIRWPVTLTKDDLTIQLPDLSLEVPTSFGRLMTAVDGILQDQLENPHALCLSCLLDRTLEHEITLDLITTDDGYVFVLGDHPSDIGESAFTALYASRY